MALVGGTLWLIGQWRMSLDDALVNPRLSSGGLPLVVSGCIRDGGPWEIYLGDHLSPPGRVSQADAWT